VHRLQSLQYKGFEGTQAVFRAPVSLWKQFQSEPGELVLQGRDLCVQLGKLLEQVGERSGRSRQQSSTVSERYLVCRQGLDLHFC
jgi:hypothetical protein